jgi:glutamate/aspartate transport system substrate-binding protein
MRMPAFRRIALAFILAGFAAGAVAQQPGAPGKLPRLERIAAANQFVIGFRESAVPFAFLDSRQHAAGYGVEIAEAVAAAVRQRIGRPDLPIRYNTVSQSTIFPLIANGVVDIECGSTTNTAERQKAVAFSYTFFVSRTRIGVPAASPIADFADLRGRSVAVARGTTTEAVVAARAAETSVELKLVPARNNLRAFQALERGSVDAFVAAEALIAGELARARMPAAFRIVGAPLDREAFACVLPVDDPAYKAVVDSAVAQLMASGALERLYDRWFLKPLDRDTPALGLPMSDELRALIRTPSDQPLR